MEENYSQRQTIYFIVIVDLLKNNFKFFSRNIIQQELNNFIYLFFYDTKSVFSISNHNILRTLFVLILHDLRTLDIELYSQFLM